MENILSNQYIQKFLSLYDDITINWKLLCIVAGLLILAHFGRNLPFVNVVYTLMSFIPTLVHELGHAVMTSITRGHVNDIHIMLTPKGIEKTGSKGYAETQPNGYISDILITFSGYIAPPLLYYWGIHCVKETHTIWFILTLAILGIYYFVKSSQKWLPILLFIFLIMSGFEFNQLPIHDLPHYLYSGYSIFLGLLLGEMILTLIITTQLAFKSKDKEWDGQALSNKTFIPSKVWWVIWTFIILTVIFSTIHV